MTHVTCRLTVKNRDQLQNPTLGNRVWITCYFYLKYTCSRVTSASSALVGSQRLCAIQIHALAHCVCVYVLLYVCMHDCADYVGFIKKVMKQMQLPQYTPMKKMEVDLRPLDAEEEKVQEGRDWRSILDPLS